MSTGPQFVNFNEPPSASLKRQIIGGDAKLPQIQALKKTDRK